METDPNSLLLAPYIDVQQLLKKYESAKSDKLPWERKWQMIQDQVFPDYRSYVNDNRGLNQANTNKIKNHLGYISGMINRFVSNLNAQLSDPSVEWLHLEFGRQFVDFRNEEVNNWLHICAEILYDLFSNPASNFYPSTYSFHLDWYTIGTACREIVIKDNNFIKFNCISMQNIAVTLNGYGEIDKVFRTFNLTAEQAYDLWADRIPVQQLQIIQNNPSNKRKFEYVEAAIPHPLRYKIPQMQYLTCIIDKQTKSLVDIKSHFDCPYVIARFFVAPQDIYGRSYVWNSMPDIRIVNKLTKCIVKAVDYATTPTWLVKDATSITPSQVAPGGLISGLDHTGRPTVQMQQLNGNIPLAMDFLARKLEDIENSLVAKEVLPPEYHNMTATEVTERKIQYSNRIRPLLVNLEHEDLHRTIIRTLNLLYQLHQLPPFPYDALQITPEQMPNPILGLRIHFSGQLAHMQQLQEISNNDMWIQKIMAYLQVDPSILDNVNFDSLIRKESKIYGIAPDIIVPQEQVQKIREERSKQQQEQQNIETDAKVLDNLMKLREAGLNTIESNRIRS